MALKFKTRQKTKKIMVVCEDTKGKTLEQLYRAARQQGKLDTGYHIYLHNNGEQERDRDIKAVADMDYKDFDVSIYVLADAKDKEHLTDAQRLALEELALLTKLPVKEVQ